jgi:hypothetical protein
VRSRVVLLLRSAEVQPLHAFRGCSSVICFLLIVIGEDVDVFLFFLIFFFFLLLAIYLRRGEDAVAWVESRIALSFFRQRFFLSAVCLPVGDHDPEARTKQTNRPFHQLRPYIPESTRSRPISKVKLVMAQSVLQWGTMREYCVL